MSSTSNVLNYIQGASYNWNTLGLSRNAIKAKLESDLSYDPQQEVYEAVAPLASVGAPSNFLDIYSKLSASSVRNRVDIDSDLTEIKNEIKETREAVKREEERISGMAAIREKERQQAAIRREEARIAERIAKEQLRAESEDKRVRTNAKRNLEKLR